MNRTPSPAPPLPSTVVSPFAFRKAGKNCSTSAISSAPSRGSHWYRLNVGNSRLDVEGRTDGEVEVEAELTSELGPASWVDDREYSLLSNCMNGAIPVPVDIYPPTPIQIKR